MGELAFPEIVPGQDGAGVVDAVGPDVTEFAVGDRVWTMLAQHTRPGGTAQEQVVLPVANVTTLPDAASFDVGASLGVPAVTAHRALTTSEDGPDRLAPGALAGLTVLVAGGAGAVGNAAIQLARWAGATVISTVSSDEKAALATAAGAQHTVNYREGDPVAAIRDLAPDGVDIVVEVAPAQNLRLDVQVIRPRGTIAIYANNGGDEVALSVRETFSTNARFQWVLLYTVGQSRTARGGRGHHRRARRRVPSGSATSTACRCTTTRSSRRPRRTPRSRPAPSARCSSTWPTTEPARPSTKNRRGHAPGRRALGFGAWPHPPSTASSASSRPWSASRRSPTATRRWSTRPPSTGCSPSWPRSSRGSTPSSS